MLVKLGGFQRTLFTKQKRRRPAAFGKIICLSILPTKLKPNLRWNLPSTKKLFIQLARKTHANMLVKLTPVIVFRNLVFWQNMISFLKDKRNASVCLDSFYVLQAQIPISFDLIFRYHIALITRFFVNLTQAKKTSTKIMGLGAIQIIHKTFWPFSDPPLNHSPNVTF